jgi:hypothetical protein
MERHLVNFSHPGCPSESRIPFAVPDVFSATLRGSGLDSCPRCADAAFSRPLRAVGLEVMLRPPETEAHSPFRVVLFLSCGRCGGVVRAEIRLDRPFSWMNLGVAINLFDFDWIDPVPASSTADGAQAPAGTPDPQAGRQTRRRKRGGHGT